MAAIDLVTARRTPAYADLLAVVDELTAAKERVAEAERNLFVVARERLTEMQVESAASLYWDWPELSPSLIASALGMTVRELATRAGPRLIRSVCSLCGDEFAVQAQSRTGAAEWARNKRFCKRCRDWPSYSKDPRLPGRRPAERIAELRGMAYADYLDTPEWKETREEALRRAFFACQMCSSKHRLHVHHRTYDRFGTEQPRDLLVLCRECHQLFHRERRLNR